jgi:signal transduction histidine kinase
MTQIDINSVITDTLDLLRGEMRQNDILLEVELPNGLEPVMGDRVQLQQVILNLVKNGVEAMTGTTHRPRMLRVSSQWDEAGNLRIAVADSGVGFDTTKAVRMFDAFFTTKPDGIGLGLSICRSIVEAHGGRLWALPNEPKGSIFCFMLPTATTRTSTDGSA